jgi:hypothetical protein
VPDLGPFGKKLGPLPVWGWLAVAGLAYYLWKKRQAAASSTQQATPSPTTLPPVAGLQVSPYGDAWGGYGAPYGGGSSGGDSSSSNLPPGSGTQVLPPSSTTTPGLGILPASPSLPGGGSSLPGAPSVPGLKQVSSGPIRRKWDVTGGPIRMPGGNLGPGPLVMGTSSPITAASKVAPQ